MFGSRLVEVRAKVLQRTFHQFACPHCGVAGCAVSPLVFSDFARHELVVVLTRVDVQKTRQDVERDFGGFANQFAKEAGLLADLISGMKMRLVFGYEAWREKLLAWDEGLDDYILEAIKADRNLRYFQSPWAQEFRLERRSPEGELIFRNVSPTPLAHAPLVLVVSSGEYVARANDRALVASDYPWLEHHWLVDSFDSEVAPHYGSIIT